VTRVVSVLAICAAMTIGVARAAPDDCEPVVRVSGDPDVARTVSASLAERGLGATATGSCPAMEARIERAGERLRVSVTDGYGRHSQREVRDAATAIALIESWARPEVVVGEELPGAGPADESPAPLLGPAAVTSATGIALVAGADYAGDGTTWARGGVAGCIAVGPACVGGRLEVASATEISSTSNHPRRTYSLAAVVELPRAFGRFTIAPGVGVGGGLARVGGVGPHLDQTGSVGSLRVVANLGMRIAIARRWAIAVELGGEAEVVGGAAAVPGNLGRAGLGLRYGAR
jgi:hypothetical protein